MLKKQKSKQKTVAEKIAETILHPNESGSESNSEDETAARVVEGDDDEYELPQAGTTEFRKRNVKLLSEQSVKYKGKIATRRDFESDVTEEEDYESSYSSEDANSPAYTQALKSELYIKQADHPVSESQVSEDDEEEQSDGFEDESIASEYSSDDKEDSHSDILNKVDQETEVQKGVCVQNQLCIWERLLELRINFQKLLSKSIQLPLPEELKDLEKNNSEYKDLKQNMCKQTCMLLQNLLTLKTHLSSQFSEVEKALQPSLKRSSLFKEYNQDEPPLKKINQYLKEELEQFRPYRNDVLLKWDDRTKLSQPGLHSKKRTLNEEYDIIKKIDNALINKSMLIEKSQQFKNSNETQENVRNPNIYDDSDFYHQQLRELIEYKANTTSNMSEVTKQFLELQKLRRKMQKKFDTRASKGRKLRYIVHNKLINFMAPHDNSTWTAESVDELSKSLFA